MPEIAVALAVLNTVLTHYIFSFQRFTLAVARRHAFDANKIAQIQTLMTPTLMGAAAWLCHLLLVTASVLLSIAFVWWAGVAYFLAELFVVSAVLPLFALNSHFAAMARRELQAHCNGPAAGVVPLLLTDVDRAELSNLV